MTYGDLYADLAGIIAAEPDPESAAQSILNYFEQLGWLDIFEEH